MNTAVLIWSLLAYNPLPAWGDMPTDPRDVIDASDCAPSDAFCDDLRPWLAYDPHGSAESYPEGT